eukprot:12630937-Alexandrium_andersonii.AAC.1
MEAEREAREERHPRPPSVSSSEVSSGIQLAPPLEGEPDRGQSMIHAQYLWARSLRRDARKRMAFTKALARATRDFIFRDREAAAQR